MIFDWLFYRTEQAVLAERERCAKIAENEKVNADETGDAGDRAYNRACDDIADSIRSDK